MFHDRNPALRDQLAAAFAWWREAGVDCGFHDEPMRWLAPAVAEERAQPPAQAARRKDPPAPPPEEARPALDRAAWPQDLASFAAWWLAEPSLDDGRVTGRVPPRGRQGAELMIVAPEPEHEDRERLLSGPQGRLLEAVLLAAGMAADDVYVASALPRHTPMVDWAAARARGIGEVLAHHIGLAAPKRLIAFGGNVCRSSETIRRINLPFYGNLTMKE
jgi:DNA polymerase